MRTRLIVIGVVAALVLAACSDGDDDDGAAGTSPSTTNAEAATARPSAGCEGATPVAPGQEQVTTTSGGAERFYFRHVPPDYTGREPMPVVLDLHGYSEGAQVHTMMSDLGAYGDAEGFITITPQGTAEPIPRWDTGFDSADYAFIGDLLDEVDETLCVDERRVFATGLSNGAFMTSALVCEYADRIAAAAPVAGIRAVDDCNPSRPVPVVAFHGTADDFVGYDGGFGGGAARLPAPDGSARTLEDASTTESTAPPAGPSIPDATTAWAERNGCKTKPIVEDVTVDVTIMRFDCPAGADAVLYTVKDGGHSWPGSEFSKAVESVVGKTTDTISANEVMWAFFTENPLPVR
jgi:polyhydroxybutyrate depolymerase